DNSSLSGTVVLSGTASATDQPAIVIGSNTALGTGVVYPVNGFALAADGVDRSLATRFIAQDLRLVGAADLQLTGALDLLGTATIGVSAPASLTLSGGVGEMTAGVAWTKVGAGRLRVASDALISGALAISAAGGELILGGSTGSIPNVASITVGVGGALEIDNSTTALSDRVRNAAPITLNGGAMVLIGNSGAAVTEVVGTVQTSSNFTSTLTNVSLGRPTIVAANQFVRSSPSVVNFQGFGADLGTANNQIRFFSPPITALSDGVLPFATVSRAGDIDFATYDLPNGVMAAVPTKTTLAGAGSSDNVKLSTSEALTAPTVVNALLLAGSGLVVSGAGSLSIDSGLLVSAGTNNSLGVAVDFSSVSPLIVVPTSPSTSNASSSLMMAGTVAGLQGLNKFGAGRLTLAAANSYQGLTSVLEGSV
ncbi:MAG TPA: hypothetical protein PLV92_25930, partial [Pirellulaceae bacterium]|nr:hypothetical protein [Pirellulaceae bacterium]